MQILKKRKEKKVEIVVLISDLIIRTITKDKEDHYMIKGPILQKDIRIPNMYAPNNRMLKYMRQKRIGLKE